MATLTFDTHAFVKELTQAGMPEEQAEVLARSQATLIDEKLATKQDLKELELRLKRDIQEMELRLKHDLTLRLGSMIVVAIGVVAALVKTSVRLILSKRLEFGRIVLMFIFLFGGFYGYSDV